MMTSLYVSLKNKTLLFFCSTFAFSFLLNSLVFFAQGNRSFTECITTASFMGLTFTLMFMGIIHNFNPMLSHKINVAFPPREGEKILKWAKVGYILDGQPVQGSLALTNQRLLFRYLREEPPMGAKQLEADVEEIDEVKLSAKSSIYLTGITVKVKNREHIFTVAMPDRWVNDIRNVVKHGHTTN